MTNITDKQVTKYDKLVRYYVRVYGGGLPYSDREDLAQDCWLHLLERQDKYDPDKGTFNTWLMYMVRDCLSKKKRKKGTVKRGKDYTNVSYDYKINEYLANNESAEDSYFSLALEDEVKRIFKGYDSRTRPLMKNKYFGKLSSEQMAKKAKMNIKRLYKILKEGDKELHKKLDDHINPEG